MRALGYSRCRVKQYIISTVYFRVTLLRTHLLQAIQALADEFHLALFVSSICSVVTTTSLVIPTGQPASPPFPPQFSFLPRVANIITLPFVGRSKGTAHCSASNLIFSPPFRLSLSPLIILVSAFRQVYIHAAGCSPSRFSFTLFLQLSSPSPIHPPSLSVSLYRAHANNDTVYATK